MHHARTPLDNKLCFALYGASMAVGRLYKPQLDALGITYPQYLVLNVLWDEDGRTIGQIAERLSLEPSTITPLVKRLAAAGIVSRERNPDDDRQVRVTLTETGRALEAKSGCVGESLLAASGMSIARLKAFSAEIRVLRDLVAAAGKSGD